MKIAIIGAGLAGLAAAWKLLSRSPCQITIFDDGTGASKIAGGLLHPYAGAKARLSWNAAAALKETHTLLQVASETLQQPVYKESGILRVAVTDEQRSHFTQTASHDDVEWWSKEQCCEAFSELLPYPGIFIRSGIHVDCPLYLTGLKRACEQKGAHYIHRTINFEEHLEYDSIIFACGKNTLQKKGIEQYTLRLTKGQLLVLRYTGILPFPIISEKYITFGPISQTIVVGATFERRWGTEEPDQGIAADDILSHIATFAPKIAQLPTLECRAGFRVWIPSHKPCVVQIGPKEWYIGALGSKGLLYHAWLAEQLVRKVCHTFDLYTQ